MASPIAKPVTRIGQCGVSNRAFTSSSACGRRLSLDIANKNREDASPMRRSLAITICIPVFNKQAALPSCLDSLDEAFAQVIGGRD